ncbi:hypothetical protein VTI74DRAFT_2925 [Chaetomium olivicolor]
MSTASVPLASLGANADFATKIQALLLPKYDTVHICLTPATATSELPEVCSGNLDTLPSSGLGSNVDRPASERRIPRAIIFGAGVQDDDVMSVMGAVRAKAPTVKMVRVTRKDIADAGADVPSPEVVAGVLKEILEGLDL